MSTSALPDTENRFRIFHQSASWIDGEVFKSDVFVTIVISPDLLHKLPSYPCYGN